jgi:hypothetical protein
MNVTEQYIKEICDRDGLIFSKDVASAVRQLGLGEEYIDVLPGSSGVIYMSGKHPYYGYFPAGNGLASVDIVIPDGPTDIIVPLDLFKKTVAELFMA